MREPKNNNAKQQPKRKVRLSLKGKVVLTGLAMSMLLTTVGGVVHAHNKAERLDRAAEAYVNTMSREELSLIASGYSPAIDEVISDQFENQRNEGNDLIREIAGLDGLYDQNPGAVSYDDYEQIVEAYKSFVKDAVWDRVGSQFYSDTDRERFCIYQRVDNGSGELILGVALGNGNYSNNSYVDGLSVSEIHSVNPNSDLGKLMTNYINILGAEDSRNQDALRKSLNKAIPLIDNFNNRVYYIDGNEIKEEKLYKAQQEAVHEIQENDYRVIEDKYGNTTVHLTDIHPEDRDER